MTVLWALVLCAGVGANHVGSGSNRWTYTPPSSPSSRVYDGVQMNFLFPDFIAHGLGGTGEFFTERIQAFCNETGAKATMTHKTVEAYRAELMYDLDSGLNFYDAFNFFGSWMPGLVEKGNHLLKLTDYVKESPELAWSDILPAVRRGVCEYKKDIYLLPADGDVIVLIYRKDLLEYHGLAKPETWEDFLAISSYFRNNVGTSAWIDSPNRTLAQEGGAGACMMTKRGDWAYADLFAYLATFLQAYGPSQGIFFDPISMEPLLNTPAAREALLLYKEIVNASTHSDRPCDKCTDDGGAGLFTMVEDMQKGKCMMGFNYMGPIKFIASGAFNTANSTIALAPVPGSTRVKALDGNGLINCADSIGACPHAVEVPKNVNGLRSPNPMVTHRVNRATYYSGGGQSWAISSHVQGQQKKNALWSFLKRLIDKENAVLSTTAADYLLDPFRQTTLDGLQVDGHQATIKFIENNWKWDQLGTMKETLGFAFTDPNSVLDLKIVDGGLYIEETDATMLKYFKGELTLDDAIRSITEMWTQRTNRIGKTDQRNLYRSVLGLEPYYDNINCTAGYQVMQGRCQPCEAGSFKAKGGPEPCTRCKAGTYQEAKQGTACNRCQLILPGSTTLGEGYTSPDDCVCPAGSFWFRSEGRAAICKECGEGLYCRGGRVPDLGLHHPPLQAPGFATGLPPHDGAEPPYIVRCRDSTQCPGQTKLGTCPPHHSGIACDACIRDYWMDAGVCKECDGSGAAVSAVMVVVCLLLLTALFCYAARRATSFSEAKVTLVLLASVSVAGIQTLGACRKLSIDWVEPLKSINQLTQVFTFEIGVIRPECIWGPQSPTLVYLGSLLAYPVFAVVLVLVFAFAYFLGQPIKIFMVVNAEGIIFTALNLSLTIAGALAWQCESNPDGTYSVVSFRNILCYDSSDHHIMMALSVMALLVYAVGFLSLVLWATLAYPVKCMSSGGISFMRNFNFLFGRFNAEQYYFVVVFAIRGLLVALFPVFLVNEPHAQLMLLALVLVSYGMIQCHLWPWRSQAANLLDTACTGSLMLVVVGGALLLDFASAEDHGKDVVQVFFITLVVVCLGSGIGMLIYYVYLSMCPPKRYGIFLSHHKVGAAVLARWTKMIMQNHVIEKVFLDSDDVDFLDGIIDTVGNNCKNLVVLLTRETLERIWCAAEITCAIMNGINVVAVRCKDWPGISDEFLNSLDTCWTNDQLAAVAAAGIEVPDIRAAYVVLRDMEMIVLDRDTDRSTHESILLDTLNSCHGLRHSLGDAVTRAASNASASDATQFQILGHLHEKESACTCYVIQLYMQRNMQMTFSLVSDPAKLEGVDCLLVILTKGALQNPEFAEALVTAWQCGISLLPVRADDNFVYPDPNFYQALHEGKIMASDFNETRGISSHSIEAAYQKLFNTLALKFTAHGSEKIQQVEVSMIAQRLEDLHTRHRATTTNTSTADDSGMLPGDDAKPDGHPVTDTVGEFNASTNRETSFNWELIRTF